MTKPNHRSRTAAGDKKTTEQLSEQGALQLEVEEPKKHPLADIISSINDEGLRKHVIDCRPVTEEEFQAAILEYDEIRKRLIFSQYVTNPEGNVYAITNLPEEFIAVLFAWVSRSPKSFKQHLQEALDSALIETPAFNQGAYARLSDKASAFHEKWTVSYGHSCYDESTHVLTKQGFKPWPDVTRNDLLASVNPETMEIEFQVPIRIVAEMYDGPMYKVDRNRIDMMVTPNHRIFANPRHLIDGHARSKYQLIKAEQLKDKCYKIKLGGFKWSADIVDTLYGYPAEPLLKLFGFFIGDGYIDKRMKHAIQFHFKKQRKMEYLQSLCEELGLILSINQGGKFYITAPDEFPSIGEIMSSCYDSNNEKQIPLDLFDLDGLLLENLYDGLINSDGHVGKTGEVYDTSSFRLVDQIQYLCTLLGWTSSASVLRPSDSENHKDLFRIFINKKLLESMINKVQYDIFDAWEDYTGMVYCAELSEHHTLIVRRNGRIHLSGNSVAEHANTHIGVESVSRLASAELELSNEFYAITEYSQRYQKPVRGGWYNPFPLNTMAYEDFEHYMNKCFDVFEKLIDGIYNHLTEGKIYPASIMEENRIRANMMKLAFEDARYALPLAMHTQLGMTANGRAWRDGIAEMMASDYVEVRDLAEDIKTEVTKVLPTLLRHANASQYKVNSKKRVRSFSKNLAPSDRAYANINLLSWQPEELAIENVVAQIIMEESGLPFAEACQRARAMGTDKQRQLIDNLLFEMGPHDMAPEYFKHVHYQVEFLISEANWHQLLRHNRRTNFTFNQPTPYSDITIPSQIKEAGLASLLDQLAQASEEFYGDIKASSFPEAAPYVVLNAHRRRIVANFNLWEAYHLFNLRTSPEAQWDIRETFIDLCAKIERIHPTLIKSAKRR